MKGHSPAPGDVRKMIVEDVDWVVDRLARRRAALVPHAPVYWRPAANAIQAHRQFLGYVLGKGGGIGFCTGEAFMIATPGCHNLWTIDDAVIPDGEWIGTGPQLWDALSSEIRESSVRFVCPAPEPQRAEFARTLGLTLHNSWWHIAVEQVRPRADGQEPCVEGANAALVPAPRIYDPGGPVLFLTKIVNVARALPAAYAEAERLGSPVVVANQPHGAASLAGALEDAGYYRHCGFFEGSLTPEK
jgi:hypothetical protein